MIHPLFRTLASSPELLAEHAGAYAELAGAEAAELAGRLRQRVWLGGAAALLAALAVGFGGVALLLVAAVPLSQMPHPALLWLVPAVPALAAAGCVAALRRVKAVPAFETLRRQWLADRALWREVSEKAHG